MYWLLAKKSQTTTRVTQGMGFASFARLASDQDTTRGGLNLNLNELENVQGMGFNDVQNRIHAGQVNLDELNENSDLSPK